MTNPHEAALEAAGRALFVRELGGDEDFSKWEPLLVEYRAQASSAITAYLTAMREAGFVVVPVEPTKGMAWAGVCGIAVDSRGVGIHETEGTAADVWTRDAMAAYRAMIAAAQEGE